MAQTTVVGLAIALPSTSDRHLIREPRETLTLEAGKGVVGDAKFAKSDYRHVNILTHDIYDWFERAFGRTRETPGGFGEQITLSSASDLVWIEPGAHVKIGPVTLELVTPRMPCKTLADTTGVERISHFVGRVGHMCRVIEGGEVRLGDVMEIA